MPHTNQFSQSETALTTPLEVGRSCKEAAGTRVYHTGLSKTAYETT